MASSDKTIAIMQPYFIPYAGYFRLFLASDILVIHDDVQFITRGWIHRNRLVNSNAELAYLTMPLKKSPVDTDILNMEFHSDAHSLWAKRIRKFPDLTADRDELKPLLDWLKALSGSPTEFILEGLRICCEMLDIPFNIVRSSAMNIPDHLKGQDRVLHIVKELQGTRYINAPGGKSLYNEDDFKKVGVALDFLPEYTGNMASILHRLLIEDAMSVRNEIEENL